MPISPNQTFHTQTPLRIRDMVVFRILNANYLEFSGKMLMIMYDC